jgi:hypothetical protein
LSLVYCARAGNRRFGFEFLDTMPCKPMGAPASQPEYHPRSIGTLDFAAPAFLRKPKPVRIDTT